MIKKNRRSLHISEQISEDESKSPVKKVVKTESAPVKDLSFKDSKSENKKEDVIPAVQISEVDNSDEYEFEDLDDVV